MSRYASIYPRNRLATAITAVSLLTTGTSVANADDNRFQLEEIIVTATRRAQSVQDIPYNISAVSGESIANAGAGDLADLMKMVPGVVFADNGARGNAQNSSIVLRGLNVTPQYNASTFANLTVPTVSTYMDDTPVFLNLKLADVERVEVLRGPQGTLYGSGALAGTVRFIHNRPDMEALSGSISGGVEFLGESDDQTYSFDGVVNLPLSDNAALRIAATYEDSGGVLDADNVFLRDSSGNPVLADPADFINSPAATRSVKDHDSAEIYGIRTSLLWNLNDNVEALLVYHHQNLDAKGNNFRDLGQDDYTVSKYPYMDQFEQEVDIYSLEVEADLGFATLTSTTSRSEMEIETERDISFLVDSLDTAFGCALYGCYPRGLFIADEPAEREDFTQEFRLVSNGEGAIDWLVGAYYNDQKASLVQDETVYGYADWANTPGSAAAVGGGPGDTFYDFFLAGFIANPADENNQFFNDRDIAFEDLALYGEVTWHVTDVWQMTVGARYFEQEYTSELLAIFSNCGVFCAQDPTDIRGIAFASQTEESKDQVFKFNTSYQLSEDTNLYFTWAEGFRHGGANALPVGAFGITADQVPYEADKTENWELGVKGSLMEGRLDYTLAVFLIDWEKPQLDAFVSAAFLPAVVNGESAESRGLEAELTGMVTENLTVSLGYNYTDAQLTDDFSVGGVTGVDGSDLPNIAKHQANLSLDYRQPLNDDYELHYHLNGQYKGRAENDLDGGRNDYELDAFSLLNASISLEAESWTITAFVNNLLDEDRATYGASTSRGVISAARPRSLGLRAAYQF